MQKYERRGKNILKTSGPEEVLDEKTLRTRQMRMNLLYKKLPMSLILKIALIIAVFCTVIGIASVFLVKPILGLVSKNMAIIDLQKKFIQYNLIQILPLIAMIAFVVGFIVCLSTKGAYKRKVALNYAKKHSTNPEEQESVREEGEEILKEAKVKGTAVFIIMSIISIITFFACFGIVGDSFRPIKQDLSDFKAGNIVKYSGRIQYTERPKDREYDYIIATDDNYNYFDSDDGWLACSKEYLHEGLLMQGNYNVEYLANTYTIVSIKNMAGLDVRGDYIRDFKAEEGYWAFGDIEVKKSEDIYGYSELSDVAKKAFDLMYGEYFSKTVREGENATFSFDLPEPITSSEYKSIQSLYEAATFGYSFPGFRYDTNDRSSISKMYAGGVVDSRVVPDNRYTQTIEKTKEIIEAMPQGLNDREKCEYIASYMLENIEAHKFSDDETEEIYYDSSYGGLVQGQADNEGDARSFSALAREAGLTTIPIVGQYKDKHYWNMVSLDGQWHYIDISCIKEAGYLQEDFLMTKDTLLEGHTSPAYLNVEFIRPPLEMQITGDTVEI